MNFSVTSWAKRAATTLLLLSISGCHPGRLGSTANGPKPHKWIQVNLLFRGDTFSEVANDMTVTLKSFDTPVPTNPPNSPAEKDGFRIVAKLTNGEQQTVSGLSYNFSRAKTMNEARTIPYCITAAEWSGSLCTQAQLSSISIFKKGKLVWEYTFPSPAADIEAKVQNCDSPFFAKDGSLHA